MRALVVFKGKVLIIRESPKYDSPNQGRYDVVGGKVEFGEKFDDCLKREIREETGLEVEIGRPFSVAEWRPVANNTQYQIVGTFFECFAGSDNIKLSPDHDKHEWIEPRDFNKYDLIETLTPVFKDYIRLKKI